MSDNRYEVIIIGAGPAGLQAAVHAARKKASVLVLGRPENSSIHRAHVENYLCVEGVREGGELLTIGLNQARASGAEILFEDALQIEQQDTGFLVRGEGGRQFESRSLIFATGISRKKLKVAGERELTGRGVSYCVDCDANFYRNLPVAVVGGHSAAVDGALTLLQYASVVHLIARDLSVSEGLKERLRTSNVVVHENTRVKEIRGETSVEGVLLENGVELEVEGVFVELGAKGAIELATILGVQLDQETFTHIDTDKKQRTNIAGVYAAGDIAGQPYQMAKAVGEGCVAGWEAANYSLKQKRQEHQRAE